MKVQLVSFQFRKIEAKRLDYVVDIINHSTADIILFPGNTLLHKKSLAELEKRISNSRLSAIIETGDGHPYLIENGTLKEFNTTQLFARSSQIQNNLKLGNEYLDELSEKRIFKICKKRCLLIQCGENNILKNYQKEGNRASFRFDDNQEMNARFSKILSSVDIVLNPIHTPMGNQGKMAKRRELFSSNGRAYFSTCNADAKHRNLRSKSLQYAYKNGVQLESEIIESEDGGYITRLFTI